MTPVTHRGQSRLPFRSSKEWATRIALSLAVAIFGYYAVTYSMAQVLRTKEPEKAYALASYDGRITAHLSEKISGLPSATPEERAESDRLARQALRQDPTAVAALSTLGLNAQVRGDLDQARRYFTQSSLLSRRNLRTRLWMIEDAVAREDIPDALYNYDIALRTSRVAPDLLFPVLTSAISDAEIRNSLAQLLKSAPAWTESFTEYVASNGEDPLATAELFGQLEGTEAQVSGRARAAIITRMVTAGSYQSAWSYYTSFRPGADYRQSRDPNFSIRPMNPTLFDWLPIGIDNGIFTGIETTADDRGMFAFSAPASVGGPLLQQFQLLPPGRYVLQGQSNGIEQRDDARPYWALNCTDGSELGRVEITNSSQSNGVFIGYFNVPSNCPEQYLRFFARPSNDVGGQSGQIKSAQIRLVS